MLVLVFSCKYLLEYLSVELIHMFFDGFISKCRIPDNIFGVMVVVGNNALVFFLLHVID